MANEPMYDKQFELEDGRVVYVRVFAETILSLYESYFKALRRARSLPTDTTSLPGRDPIREFYVNQYRSRNEKPDEAEILELVRDFYNNELREVQNFAFLLSFFDVRENNEVFTEEPEPYAAEEPVSAFLDPEPTLPIDLNNKVERRLKQILDTVAENQEILAYIQEITQTIAIRAEAMAAEAQFRKAKAPKRAAKRA